MGIKDVFVTESELRNLSSAQKEVDNWGIHYHYQVLSYLRKFRLRLNRDDYMVAQICYDIVQQKYQSYTSDKALPEHKVALLGALIIRVVQSCFPYAVFCTAREERNKIVEKIINPKSKGFLLDFDQSLPQDSVCVFFSQVMKCNIGDPDRLFLILNKYKTAKSCVEKHNLIRWC